MLKNKILKEESHEDLEKLVYHISHDLHEPIRTISGFIKLISKQSSEDFKKENSECLQFIDSAIERMKNRVDGLRLYLLADVIKPQKLSSEKISKILNEALYRLQKSIQLLKAEVQVEKIYPEIFFDPKALELIFYHLIENALRFQKKDSMPRVKIKGEKIKDSWACFAVSDNGIGIHKEHFDKIYGLFQKLHPLDEYPGIGAGLSFIKRSLECHKGKIELESEMDKGSTFFLTFPTKTNQLA